MKFLSAEHCNFPAEYISTLFRLFSLWPQGNLFFSQRILWDWGVFGKLGVDDLKMRGSMNAPPGGRLFSSCKIGNSLQRNTPQNKGVTFTYLTKRPSQILQKIEHKSK